MKKPVCVWHGLGLLVLIFSLFVVDASAQPTPESPVPLPVPFTPIVDNANVIDAETKRRLETIYNGLKERANIEFAVVTVDTLGDRDIFDFSLAIARGWGIGAKDGEKAGLLLVVAIRDRKYFTQVSRHLEGDLPDGVVGQIQRQRLVPAFRQSNYSKGIFDTIQAYVATLAAKRGFSIEGIDQSQAFQMEERRPRATRPQLSLGTMCAGAAIIIFILILLSAGSRGGRRGGRGGGGCLQALFWGSLFSNLGGGGRGWGSSSGWGGGGFGGSGGFGGGFGGGGDFGGGGAGGSW